MGNQNASLDIDYNGGIRRYIATATNIDVDRPDNLVSAAFTVTFTCTQAFGQDVNQTTIMNASGRTLGVYNDSYTFLGTAPYQSPVFTIGYTAVSTGTQSVVVGNNNNGQQITVTRVWTAGDVLVIDSTTSNVTVNSLPASFTGAFPLFSPGNGSVGYIDSFTTRTFNIAGSLNVRYL